MFWGCLFVNLRGMYYTSILSNIIVLIKYTGMYTEYYWYIYCVNVGKKYYDHILPVEFAKVYICDTVYNVMKNLA